MWTLAALAQLALAQPQPSTEGESACLTDGQSLWGAHKTLRPDGGVDLQVTAGSISLPRYMMRERCDGPLQVSMPSIALRTLHLADGRQLYAIPPKWGQRGGSIWSVTLLDGRFIDIPAPHVAEIGPLPEDVPDLLPVFEAMRARDERRGQSTTTAVIGAFIGVAVVGGAFVVLDAMWFPNGQYY